MDERHLPALALNLAFRDEGAEPAAECPIDRTRRSARLLYILEEVDDDRLRGVLGNIAGFDLDLHNDAPSNRQLLRHNDDSERARKGSKQALGASSGWQFVAVQKEG